MGAIAGGKNLYSGIVDGPTTEFKIVDKDDNSFGFVVYMLRLQTCGRNRTVRMYVTNDDVTEDLIIHGHKSTTEFTDSVTILNFPDGFYFSQGSDIYIESDGDDVSTCFSIFAYTLTAND